MNDQDNLLSQRFDRGQLSATRHRVTRCAAVAGLAGSALSDFVLAVNEIMTNAVLHGGGHGRLRMWLSTGRLHCEVSDHGPGGRPERFTGLRPPSYAFGGRGMYLVRQLCETVTVDTGPAGTTVAITFPAR
jgi:anti-sigma regulatory factor (Ser/Thr protein kinase)